MVSTLAHVHRLAFLLGVLVCSIILPTDQAVTPHALSVPFQLEIDTERSDYAKLLDAADIQPFTLTKLTFSSDVQFQEQEFFYLVDMKVGDTVSVATLKKAINHIIKKNKFQTMVVYGTAYDAGVHIHIDLQGFWTFDKLKLHSFMLGKDRYRQFYFLESGERFDKQKHEHSLQALRQELVDEGYCHHDISCSFDYDTSTKSVIVHLYIQKGQPTHIHNITLKVGVHDESVSADEQQQLYAYILKQLDNHLASYTKTALNQEMRQIKRYLAKKGFVQTGINLQETRNAITNSVDLNFTIDIYRKREFVFKGNQFFTADDLLDRMLLFGQAVWLLPITILQQELEQFYYSKGFWDITIQADEQDKAYVFTITEGNRARIVDVVFDGITHGSAEQLRTDYFAALLDGIYYDQEKVEKALDECLNWYVAQGFLDAKLVKKEFTPLDQLHAFALAIAIYEGPRVQVTKITLDGFEALLEQGPFVKYTHNSSPIPFIMRDIEEQQRWLANYFQGQGYCRTHIKPEFVRNQESMEIHWLITVQAEKNCFGKTIVQGSCDFPFEYIVRELRYQQGQLWDKAKLNESLLSLRDLEIFENIHLMPYDLSAQDTDKTIMLKLQKDDPFEIRVRTGFALQQVNKQLNNAGITYRAGGTFIAKNPFNAGDQLRIDGDVDLSQHSFVVQYRRFWLFNLPIRTLLQGYSNLIQQPGLIGFKKNLYQVQQQGIMLGLTRKFDCISTGVNLGIDCTRTSIREENMGVSERFALDVAQAINFEPRLLNVLVPYILIEPTLLIDYVDNKLQPTRGFFTLLTVRGMFPFGNERFDTFFVRFLAEQSVYIPLMPFVVALRLRGGHMFNRDLRNIAPNERFYLGGANSIRSYETDRCPPLGVVVGDGERFQLVPQGGKTMMNANIEVRFPIFREMGGVVFQDLGLLFGDHIGKIDPENLLAGTGFGARYNTPLGPLRFDFAWKWRKHNPQESSYAWFLTLGNAF